MDKKYTEVESKENIYIYKIVDILAQKSYIGIRKIDFEIEKDFYYGEDIFSDEYFLKCGKSNFKKEVLSKELTMSMATLFIDEYIKVIDATFIPDISVSIGENKDFRRRVSGTKKKVICLNNGKIFDSAIEACEFCNLKPTSISKACCNKSLSAGKDPETGEKLKWMYLEEYYALKNGSTYTPKKTKRIYKTKKVLCKTTNKEFNSLKEASLKYNISSSSISACCNGKTKYAGKLPDTSEPLEWCFI